MDALESVTPEMEFQSTLPVWGATVMKGVDIAYDSYISIHAPRVGSDDWSQESIQDILGFQSTLPVWGATMPYTSRHGKPCISIHAPRVGSDT